MAAVVAVVTTACPPTGPVVDVTAPVFGAPSGTAVTSTGPMGAVVPYTVDATDDVDADVDITCTPSANELFAVGETPVECTATDDADNVARTSFSLLVSENPDWLAPGCYPNVSNVDVTYNGPQDTVDNVDVHIMSSDGTCTGPAVKYTLVRADDKPAADTLCQTLVGQNARFAPATYGYPFPADAWGCRLATEGPDTIPPIIILPEPFIVGSAGPTGAIAEYSIDSYDLDGPTTDECTPTSGSELPVGVNTINCTATDVAGNTTSASFEITVTTDTLWGHAGCYGSSTGNNDLSYNGYQDTAGNLRAYFNADDGSCTGAGSVAFTMVKATDTTIASVLCQSLGALPGNINLVASGWAGFPTHAYMCFSQDSGGPPPTTTTTSTTTSTTTTAPPDTTPPVLNLPADITTAATSAAGANVTYTATATDNIDGNTPVTCNPASGTAFAVGVTLVACSATDTAGNPTNGTFNITVTPWVGMIKVAATNSTSCAVASNGTVHCWATSGYRFAGIEDAVDIAGGSGGYCVLQASGRVSCWGTSSRGFRGFPQVRDDLLDSNRVTVVPGITDAVAIDVSDGASGEGVCATLASGQVRCWGVISEVMTNGAPMDGPGATTQPATRYPRLVNSLPGVAKVAVNPHPAHSCALLVAGTVRCWGPAATLGAGTTSISVPGGNVQNLTNVRDVAVGASHTCATRADGTVWCWGANNAKQLGPGTTATTQMYPVQVPGITNAAGPIDATDNTTCAVMTDGTMRCWGDSFLGVLPAPTVSTVVTPAGITDATEVSVGKTHRCAVRATGQVACWGSTSATGIGPQAGRGPLPTTVSVIPVSTPAALTDLIDPVVTVPARVDATATGPGGVAVNYQASAFDEHDGAIPVTCTTPSGSVFPVGTTPVECSATDAKGNTRVRRFDVVVTQATSGVVDVEALGRGSCALLFDGTASCWGTTTAGVDIAPTVVDSPALTGIVDIAGSDSGNPVHDHVCFLLSSGKVRCRGNNSDGQLGFKSSAPTSNATVEVFGLTDATAIDAGQYSTCAIVTAGRVMCWGDNQYSQLGFGAPGFDLSYPSIPVNYVTGATSISVGALGGCALISNGTVMCWGGLDSPSGVPAITTAVSVAVTRNAACALLADATVRCWGMNELGQLGSGGIDPQAKLFTPAQVVDLPATASIDAGNGHFCATSTGGIVRCWGDNSSEQLGDGVAPYSTPTPVVVDGVEGVTTLSAGDRHNCVIAAAGTVRCWGRSGDGQLGGGPSVARRSPEGVLGLTPGSVSAVGLGPQHTCAVVAGGAAQCWGDNSHAQLGDGTTTQRDFPVDVDLDVPVSAIEAGGSGSCAITAVSHEVVCWGGPNFYDRARDAQMGPFYGTSLSVAPYFRCAVATGGTIQCAGLAYDGELGNGSQGWPPAGSPPSWLPSSVQVRTITSAVKVSSGESHSCATVTDGRVYCWGSGGYGQLGNNSTSSRSSPVLAQGITNAVDVSVGKTHSCALLADGQVKCWGYNSSGQLGNGNTTQQRVPVLVPGVTGATAIAAGLNFTCAVLGGPVKCWGANNSGQLGTGNTVGQLTPISVLGLTDVATIAAGDEHICAIRATGELRCWGDNTSGQLGIGRGQSSNRPLKVADLG